MLQCHFKAAKDQVSKRFALIPNRVWFTDAVVPDVFCDVVRKYKAGLRLTTAVTYAGDSKHGRVTWCDY